MSGYNVSSFIVMLLLIILGNSLESNILKPLDNLEKKYSVFPDSLRLKMLQEAKKMFYFAYDNYMEYAYPMDELNPIYCIGRGPDYNDPSNININDVLGDFSLTLVDSLDTLAILGNTSEFQYAVRKVVRNVHFNKENIVQVFEANIRIVGGLISAHLLIMDPDKPFGELKPPWYDGELLKLAHDLASRLLPAFEKSSSGIPYPRVSLSGGVPEDTISETCTAGAGSLLLEFGLLSRLLNDPVYEGYARRAVHALWNSRSKNTGLLGNAIDAKSGRWIGRMSGLGAGLDSFYEYLLKSYILFGEITDYEMFVKIYQSIKRYMRRGRQHCNEGVGEHPLYVNVDMNSGAVYSTWIDSLQAAFAGVQVLHGDVEEAICAHALYYTLWKFYGVLPERWNWQLMTTDLSFYPLRPELIESTYLLYRATKNPFYLHVGKEILESLNNITKTDCGYATVHNVQDRSLEDRMESFFLSETCKYLYLLFDLENHVNKHFTDYIFSTEGHLFPINKNFRSQDWTKETKSENQSIAYGTCQQVHPDRTHFLPMKSKYLIQITETVGLNMTL